jgi:predicted nucleic acid-binding protein
VDSSVMIALRLDEAAAESLRERLATYDQLVSSSLLEAEFASACRRENRTFDPAFLGSISPIMPPAPLTAQIATVVASGYVRGADCLHLATALYFEAMTGSLSFVTLDQRQRDVAVALGFVV